MITRNFDPRQRYRVVLYLRMSSDKQNPRSPDQQREEIKRRLRLRGYDWEIIAEYRDDARSGRVQRKRKQYQKMLADIRSGRLNVDLILVDTSERIGRHNRVAEVRRDLRERNGVLLLTASNDFADPNTPQGRVFAAFEDLRGEQENWNKAHQVKRGKRDLAQRGYWPGGPTPAGFLLRKVIVMVGGRETVAGSKLYADPEMAWVIRAAFDRAHQTGDGQTKVAQWLNADPAVPDKLKPVNGATVGHWLDSELYKGILVWDAHSTDIIDDVRVVEPNPEEEILHVPDFCEALVSADVWDAVQRVRQARRDALAAKKVATDGDGKLIAPLTRGMTLRYPLTGLVRCGSCGASMRPNASGAPSGTGRKYCYYTCPRSIDGGCDNRRTVPEQWLRETVISRLREVLFPADGI